MSWMKTGYEATERAYEDMGGKSGPRRVWLKPEETKRFLFLDDDPCCFWEHNFQMGGNWLNWEPCIVRNKLGPNCPICNAGEKMYPYFVGLHTTICMSPWFTKKGKEEVNFQREIFAAKLGGKDKPGVLKKLERLKKQHGRLRGLVFDVYRSGKKTESCGDEFTLVEKVDPKEIDAYAREQLGAYAKRLNEKLPADKKATIESILKRNPWDSYDFEKLIKPRDEDELRRMFRGYDGGNDRGDSGRDSSDGDNESSGDDIPY